MNPDSIIFELSVIVVGAAVLGALFLYAKQPIIIAYIAIEKSHKSRSWDGFEGVSGPRCVGHFFWTLKTQHTKHERYM